MLDALEAVGYDLDAEAKEEWGQGPAVRQARAELRKASSQPSAARADPQ